MKIRMFLVILVMSLVSPWVSAQDEDEEDRERNRDRHRDHDHDLPYTYLDISALEYDMDFGGIDIEPDGYKLDLSVSLGDSLYGIIERNKTDGKIGNSSFDFDTEGYGFGFHGDSWFASYTYNTWEFDDTEFDVDTIRVGFRNMWTDNLEFNASYSWNNIEDADNDDGFQVGFAYELFNNFHIVTEYETIGGDLDIDYLTAGIRLSF